MRTASRMTWGRKLPGLLGRWAEWSHLPELNDKVDCSVSDATKYDEIEKQKNKFNSREPFHHLLLKSGRRVDRPSPILSRWF